MKKKGTIWKWVGSVILVLFAMVSFSSTGIISGLLFLICGVYVCPVFKSFLQKKGIEINKTLSIVGVIVICIIAIMTFPSLEKEDEVKTIESNTTADVVSAVEETVSAEASKAEAPVTETAVAEITVAETTAAETTVEETTVAETTVAETAVVESIVEETTVVETTVEEITPEETTTAETTVTETQGQTPQSSNLDKFKGNITYTGHYYATPKGEKFHYSAECGGKNSEEITEDEVVRRGLEPCGTCVLQ